MGLVHVHIERPGEVVVVMDGDGEDRPEDVPRLLEELDPSEACVVFAERMRRMEGYSFRVGYRLFRALHRVLVGIDIKVGNFSAVSPGALSSLVVASDLWNHFAAAVVRSNLETRRVPLPRGRRLLGSSRMTPVSLVIHGLSAILVFSDVVPVRLLITSVWLLIASAVFGGALMGGLLGLYSLPQLVSTLSEFGILLGVGSTVACALFSFAVISRRANATFLPIRDAAYFVGARRRIHPSPDE